MSSLNKVMLIGNLGQDPDVRSMQNGGRVCNLSIATSETWKDKNTGEKKEKTEWHRVVVFQEGLVNICEQYLRKGSKVFIEGKLETRKWQDQSGQDKYTTEIVLKAFNSNMIMLGGNQSEGQQSQSYQAQNTSQGNQSQSTPPQNNYDDFEDDIPF